MSASILIVEDDRDIHAILRRQLENEGFTVSVVENGKEGLERALGGSFQLVVLDINLPGMSGLEICKSLRTNKPQLPVMMLSARDEEIDRVLGLELGADDYVTKPFSVREVVARVKALLRRIDDLGSKPLADTSHRQILRFGEVSIDFDQRKVIMRGETIKLTATEFDLLAFLATNPGRVYTREQLVESVWGYSSSGYERSVNTIMSRLRSKLEVDPENPSYLITVWGVGYRFGEMETPTS